MAKVKICLDSACTKYIYCEDGTTVIQKKPECDTNFKSGKKYNEDFDLIARGTRKTVFTSDEIFKDPVVGKELELKSDDDTELLVEPAEEIKALEKRLEELKKKEKSED